jgi:biopolymer transport protein ExbD
MAEINIIPLVDVTLVLLIIFMATTAFVKENGLNMKLPKAKTGQSAPQANRDMSIALTRDGRLFLDGQPSSEAAIASAMARRAKSDSQARVVIKGDENIEYARVVRLVDLARQSGLPRITLDTRAPGDP